MKKALFITACMLCLYGYGQTSKKFVFKLGSEYSPPRKSEDLYFFGNDKLGIVNLTLKKGELTILRFDSKSLAMSSDKQIEVPDATSNMLSEEVVEMGGSYYWLHSDWDKKNAREKLSYDIVDIAAGKIAKSDIPLVESDKLAGTGFGALRGGVTNLIKTGKYRYDYDADHKYLLVNYRIAPTERNDKKNYDRIGLFLFDSSMKKLWGDEFTMPYTEAIMDNEDIAVDGFGNAYLLAKVYETDARKEVDKETGKPGYHYELMKFSKGNKKPYIMSISTDNYFVRSASLIENKQGEMIVASTYSKKAKSSGTDGIFLAAVDATGKLIPYKNGHYEFPLEDLKKFESSRNQKKMENKNDYEAPNLTVRNVLIEKDGSVLIACEEYRLEVRYVTRSSGSTVTYRYYFDDIIAARINADGKMEWVRKIPKRQYGYTEGAKRYKNEGHETLGFKLISDESGYYFLYLDNKKNLELGNDEAPKAHMNGAGGQVMVVKIDSKGTLSKEIVFDTRDEEVMIAPAEFTRINGNQFIGRAKLKKNVFQPLLITVK